jgi:DNA polymerase I-like protein with 3'-5' exonuclease and polymerase domains
MAKKSMSRGGVGGMQLPLITPEGNWRPPRLADLPQDWNAVKRIGFDTETRDEELKKMGCGARRPGCYMVGFSVALEYGPSFYVPLRHDGGDNVEDPEQALAYLRHQTKNFRGQVVGANIQYDLDYLAEEGGWFDQAEYIRDVQIADPLIYELHMSYSLQNIAERFSLPGKDQSLLAEAARAYGVDPKGGLWRLPARYVGPYAEQDAQLPLQLLRLQERRIDALDLWNIYNLESQVTPVLVKMRRRGVLVNYDHLVKMEDWARGEEKVSLDFVERETGYQVGVGNVWKAEAMAEPLKRMGIEVPVTAQGSDSIDKDFLSGIKHPVAQALARARKVNKLRTTFGASVRRYMINGRIHCTFNQIAVDDGTGGGMKGARYGRLSCVDPNLQQQPSRDEFAKDWRKVYIPEPGQLWASNDYSQQEPRWTTHFAAVYPFEDSWVSEAANRAAQVYIDDPNADNHDTMTRIVYGDAFVASADKATYKRARSNCKLIYLGLCYGEGGAKLCDDLGYPTRWSAAYKNGRERVVEYYDREEEARAVQQEKGAFVWRSAGEEGQRILDQFNENAPFIGKLAKAAEAIAKVKGEVKTIMGRRLHFPQQADGYQWTHKALNRVIQGSSADQTKKALVEIDRAGHFIQLQVHDEITASVEDESEARAIAEIMRNCVPAKVPFKVDTECGSSWGDSMG